MDYPKSKVTELKEILTSRGLSTKGVKAELIARLEEDDAAPIAPAAPAQDEAEVEIPSTEPAKVDESAQVEESAAAPAVAPAPASELSPRPHPEASELMKQTAQAEGVVETLEAQDEVEIQAEQEGGIGAETATKSEATDAPPSLTSRLSTQDGEKKPEQQEEGGPSMLSAIASAHSAGVEAIVPGESSALPLQAESAPASTSTSNPPRKAAKGSAPLSSLAPPHPPTRALRVTGLVRPMMLPSLKEMLREKFGELDESEEVKGGVWLDGIKSAGWIMFKEVASAQQLFETFNSKPFPSSDSFRTPVSFFYAPAEQIPRLLQEEEDFWEKERGRMDIVATTSQPAEGGGERKYEYSTRPVRQQKKIRDPKPPPPSATAAHSISGAAAGGQGLSIRGSGFNKRAGAAANGAGASTVADLPMDASSLPPVSFPPVRSPKQDRSSADGRGRGSRAEGRYQPYPPPGDRDVAPAPIADPYAKAASPSSAGPLRDAQTELEISRSRDAAASAYAGRGGRGPSGPPSAAYDSRRDDYGSARGGYDHERSGRGYDRGGGGGGGGGYGYRGGYDRYDERDRDRDGRRRGYDYDYDYNYDYDRRAPVQAATRDERGYSGRSNGNGSGSGNAGGFRDAKAVRGASPGWMGDRPPPPAGPARTSGGDRREPHGRDRERERERNRYDRPSSSRDDYPGGRGEGEAKDRAKRDRSPRGARAGAVEEDRYVPRARNERD